MRIYENKTIIHVIGIPVIIILSLLPFVFTRSATATKIRESKAAIESAERSLASAEERTAEAKKFINELNGTIQSERENNIRLEKRYRELETNYNRERELYTELRNSIGKAGTGLVGITDINAECAKIIGECIEIVGVGTD